MKNTIYLYGKASLLKIVIQILPDYKILPITLDQINSENFKNNNIILFGDLGLEKKIKKYFFFLNSAIFFIKNKSSQIEKSEYENINFFYGTLGVKKFEDEIKTYFITKKIILNEIEIFGDKITNTKLGLSLPLTSLEKEILIFLFENKRIGKDYLLEKIIKIKKETETKTAESHITRIRGKLLRVESEFQIKTKEDIFYLDY